MDVELSLIDFLEDADGALVNPRGKITDTTNLQDSMQEVGQQDDVLLWRQNGERFWVKDGHRRVTAARALGWKTVRARVVEDDNDPLLMMVVADVRDKIPMSKKGRALRTLIETRGMSLVRAARASGMAPAEAQLYIDLTDAPETLQRRVDRGEVAISAWKEMRHKSKSLQQEIADMPNPTVRAIRKAMKRTPVTVPMLLGQDVPVNNELVGLARTLKNRINNEWALLGELERIQITSIIGEVAISIEAVPA